MEELYLWIIIIIISFIVAFADFIYKYASSKLAELNELNFKNYFADGIIVISWFITVISKLLIGVPYSTLDLSIAVSVHNTLVVFFGSVFGIVILKENGDTNLLKAWFLTFISCVLLIW